MKIVSDIIEEYAEQHSTLEDDLLKELRLETNRKLLKAAMLSSHLQAQFLQMIVAIAKPKNVLEIGTFAAYSTICIARSLESGSKLITIEKNEELEKFIKRWINKAQLSDKVELIIGDALEEIPKIRKKFDIVFIDADKENYVKYYNLVFPMVNKNGLIIADNVLWYGKVLKNRPDKETKGIIQYNELLVRDNRIQNVLLPFRDGLMIARKIE